MSYYLINLIPNYIEKIIFFSELFSLVLVRSLQKGCFLLLSSSFTSKVLHPWHSLCSIQEYNFSHSKGTPWIFNPSIFPHFNHHFLHWNFPSTILSIFSSIYFTYIFPTHPGPSFFKKEKRNRLCHLLLTSKWQN